MRLSTLPGLLLVGAALVLLGWDLWSWQETGSWRMRAAGEVWFTLHSDSLNGTQALVQRYLWPPLWDPGIQTVLLWPAWLVVGAPGLLLSFLTWRPRRRRTFGTR